jgi:RNA polymerase sigma-70 factor (ECF subfamily)
MSTRLEDQTNPTLISRLRRMPNDPEAWQQFIDRYGPRILAWCRHWGLQSADASDVMQSVLLKLVGAMQTFEYDPSRSFRAWLKTLTQHAWLDTVRSVRGNVLAGEAATARLDSIEARDDLVQELQQTYERELLELAMQRVRLQVLPRTWEAFQRTVLEGQPPAQVAAALQTTLVNVYKSRSNVQKRLADEVKHLEGGEE